MEKANKGDGFFFDYQPNSVITQPNPKIWTITGQTFKVRYCLKILDLFYVFDDGLKLIAQTLATKLFQIFSKAAFKTDLHACVPSKRKISSRLTVSVSSPALIA